MEEIRHRVARLAGAVGGGGEVAGAVGGIVRSIGRSIVAVFDDPDRDLEGATGDERGIAPTPATAKWRISAASRPADTKTAPESLLQCRLSP